MIRNLGFISALNLKVFYFLLYLSTMRRHFSMVNNKLIKTHKISLLFPCLMSL